jgi:hypothetical protein
MIMKNLVSHASIGNQKNLDDKIMQSSISSSLHKSKGLICYTPFQDFEFYDTSFRNLERENLMEKPLFDEEYDNKEIDND